MLRYSEMRKKLQILIQILLFFWTEIREKQILSWKIKTQKNEEKKMQIHWSTW